MARSGVTMRWNGLDRLAGKAKRLANTQGVLAEIGETLVSSAILRFREGKGPNGETWEPSQRALEQDGETLVDTARLRNSIVYATDAKKVMVGTNVAYAAIHQFGGKTGRGHRVNMPARPYIGISQDDADEIRDILADHIRDSFKG